MREDLYEQCSFHIAEKIPSSVKLGTRPISFRMRSYSSGLSPWAATSSGVICGSFMCMRRSRARSGKVETGFPSRQTRNAFARRSCSNKELEHDGEITSCSSDVANHAKVDPVDQI